MKPISILALSALIITIGTLLVSCGENASEQRKREREEAELRRDKAVAAAVDRYPGSKEANDVDWGGDLTIQKQRYLEQNKGAIYYQQPYFFDLADESGALILTFSDYDVHYRIRCEEEQLTSLLGDKDAYDGDWLVFFNISDFRRPALSIRGEVIDEADADVILEESDAVIALGSLVGVHKID